ncbi:SFCGS family glycine-rich protein [uncultured Traorella sp.]|uniref:SFCGS family glycine-rich protein n=1 Tax=uncultured Traorella sp. TaxID=1929048 RepID=UPI0025CDB684|nr:SFCGS family glycine-rich protein [uncultured Traorella sp.]
MEKVKVVIAHRMGKGQNVARGVEMAGGEAILVPGVGADMKLGEVMKKNNANFGISFCGGGGGGALTAQNQYGYKAIYDMRDVNAGVSAIKNGYEALGFGFMDTEELGKALTEAYQKYRM